MNTRTAEQQLAFDRAQVMLAFAEGKKCQLYMPSRDMWIDSEVMVWDWNSYSYRVKPEPRYVPLEYGDIMPGDWVRIPTVDLITAVTQSNRSEIAAGHNDFVSYEKLKSRGYEFSRDRGQTWNLCRKEAK